MIDRKEGDLKKGEIDGKSEGGTFEAGRSGNLENPLFSNAHVGKYLPDNTSAHMSPTANIILYPNNSLLQP